MNKSDSNDIELQQLESEKDGYSDCEVLSMIFSRVMKFRSIFFFGCFSSVVNKIFDILPPVVTGIIVDVVSGTAPDWVSWFGDPEDATHMAIFITVICVAIHLFESIFQYLYEISFKKVAQYVQHEVRCEVYDHIQRREMKFFSDHRLGGTLAMLNDDVNQLERFLNEGFNQILQLFILFCFALPYLLIASWRLALIGLCPVPLLLFATFKYHAMVQPRYAAIRSEVGNLSARLENNISGILVIKSFNAEVKESQRVAEASAAYKDANIHAIEMSSFFVPLVRMFVAMGFSFGLGFGGYWTMQEEHDISVAKLVVFSMLIQRCLWPLVRLGQIVDDFERSLAAARRTFGLLETPPQIQDPETPVDLKEAQSVGVTFDDVTFRYADDMPLTVDHMDLKIPAGQFIGIAGASGGGKSTLMKLLLRLWEPSSGRILLNGESIRDLPLKTLRQNISLVSQDVYLFHGNVRENIAYGTSDATLEQIREAARLAHFDGDVQNLPKKYDTIIGERGVKLSGGQRQRLSIARAILKNAPILILDEATSSVDTYTELHIQQNLQTLIEGKTAIVIAHRLSTIKNADRIVVLKDGKIHESGTHDELVANNQVYSLLWSLQTGLDADQNMPTSI